MSRESASKKDSAGDAKKEGDPAPAAAAAAPLSYTAYGGGAGGPEGVLLGY